MDGSSTEVLPSQPLNKLNPWNIHPPVETSSFQDVMSEELAKSLQETEEKQYLQGLKTTTQYEEFYISEDSDDCKSDFLLAEMLQRQFDQEHDDLLKREEAKLNGSSKISISFANYRKVPENAFDEDDSNSDLEEPKEWDSFEEAQKNSPIVGKSGFVRQGSSITTKHDATICGRRNACRVMEFPPGFETGDGGGFDMKLSNSVYNQLKVHSYSEAKKKNRLHDKIEKSTAELAFDPKTRLLLYKLVNNGSLEAINGCISTGKEAVVVHAFGGHLEDKALPAECALKVFKTTLNEFKNRDKYIRDDYRFKDRFGKQNPRKIIRLWAEKEMHNLERMKKVGIPCPEVVLLKKHVLIMSFIGKDHKPAPKLKDVHLSTAQLELAYEQTVELMKKMYSECNLIHADLSEYNILWHEDSVWFIDVSQSIEPIHPCALEFLYRDCCNISNFFTKQGVANVLSSKELFKSVCNLDLPGEGAELLSQIQDYERNEELLTHGLTSKNYSFNFFFDKATSQNTTAS